MGRPGASRPTAAHVAGLAARVHYNRIMRKWLFCLGVTGFTAYAADVAIVEEIVCKVNGDIITRS